ncbi:MAG: DUF1385 domain-containing protein [Anaerolineales bacterium]|nr:DUF1385 domain-containing protein [Anaerolineales bacterium]
MNKQKEQTTKLPNYGGQAVIEGVMMRGKKAAAIAMRAPDGEIIIHKEELNKIYQSRIMQIPFLRGLIGLYDALILGMKALTISANIQTGEDEKIEGPALFLTFALSMSIAIVVFFLIPAGLGQAVERFWEWNAWMGNLLEGLVRLAFLILYMWGIGQMEDIKRVFSYHGAEHKVINTYEAGVELVPEKVQTFSREHPRCGTAFLLIVVLFSVLLFTALGPMTLFWRLVSRILLLPLLAGVAYEYLRWTAENQHHPVIKWLLKPNLALQRLTTNEPSLEIIEVSIAAFNAMREAEEA